MSIIETSILKELDSHNFSGNEISTIMKRLDTKEKRDSFLTYMLNNRGVIISLKEALCEIG